MAPSLEEVIYDLARAALDEQREVVAGLRSRAAPVLAGAGALAALLAKPAIDDGLSFAHHPAHATLVCVGILGAVVALFGAILVLATRDFGFSVDVEPLYEAAFPDRHDPRCSSGASPSHTASAEWRTAMACALFSASSSSAFSAWCSRSLVSRQRSPYTDGMAITPQSAPKPAAPSAPQPKPPKIEPYPNIFFVEGKAVGSTGERRSS